jgi:hypothetical protein
VDLVISIVRNLVTATSKYMISWGLEKRNTQIIYQENLSITNDSPSRGLAMFRDQGRIPDKIGVWIESYVQPNIRISPEQVDILTLCRTDRRNSILVESLIVHELVHYLQKITINERDNSVSSYPCRLEDCEHTKKYFNQRIEIEAFAMQSLHYYSQVDKSRIANCRSIVGLRNILLLDFDKDAANCLGIRNGEDVE